MLECNVIFTDPGATATDACNGLKVTVQVISNNMDISITRTYQIIYRYTASRKENLKCFVAYLCSRLLYGFGKWVRISTRVFSNCSLSFHVKAQRTGRPFSSGQVFPSLSITKFTVFISTTSSAQVQ